MSINREENLKTYETKPEIRKADGYTVVESQINLRCGLCLRPSGKVAEECKKYGKNIYFKRKNDDKLYDGKYIIEILSTGTAKGSKLQILVEGEDEEAENMALRLHHALSTESFLPHFEE